MHRMPECRVSEMSESSTTPGRESPELLAPTELFDQKFFPLKDYQLIKIYDYHFKIIDVLDKIVALTSITQENEVDDSEEYHKLKKRADEYCARFSRNHLYPLKRELESLKSFLEQNDSFRNGTRDTLRKKLTSAYQNAYSTIQSYLLFRNQQNLPISDKLKEVIILLLNQHDICKNILIPIQRSVGGNLELFSEKCCQILENLRVEEEGRKCSKRVAKKIIKRQKSELNLATDLSMYQPKLGSWPIKSQALANLKVGPIVRVRSRSAFSGTKSSRTSGSDNKPLVRGRSKKQISSARDRNNLNLDKVLPPDKDIETEIEKFPLGSCRTKERIPSAKISVKSDCSKSVKKGVTPRPCTSKNNVQEDLQPSSSCVSINRNVGFFHVVSDDGPKNITVKNINDEELVLDKPVEKRKALFPFLPNEGKQNLVTLNLSQDLLKELRLMGYSPLAKPKIQEEESWKIISRISDSILDTLFGDILDETLNDECIVALCENELKAQEKD